MVLLSTNTYQHNPFGKSSAFPQLIEMKIKIKGYYLTNRLLEGTFYLFCNFYRL